MGWIHLDDVVSFQWIVKTWRWHGTKNVYKVTLGTLAPYSALHDGIRVSFGIKNTSADVSLSHKRGVHDVRSVKWFEGFIVPSILGHTVDRIGLKIAWRRRVRLFLFNMRRWRCSVWCEVRFMTIVKQLRFAREFGVLYMHEGAQESQGILIVLHWGILELGVFIFE